MGFDNYEGTSSSEPDIENIAADEEHAGLKAGGVPVHPLGIERHKQLYAEHMAKIERKPLTPELTAQYGKDWDVMDDFTRRQLNKSIPAIKKEVLEKKQKDAQLAPEKSGITTSKTAETAPQLDAAERKRVNDFNWKRRNKTQTLAKGASGLVDTEAGQKLFRRGNVGDIELPGFPDINAPEQREAMGNPRTTQEHNYQVPFKHMVSPKQGIDNDTVFHEKLSGIINDLTSRPLKGQTSIPLSNTHLPDRFIGDTYHFVGGQSTSGLSERNRLSQEASQALARSAAAHANNMVPEAYKHYSDAVVATNKLAHHVNGLDANRGAEISAGPSPELLKTGNLLAGYADKINLDKWQRSRRSGK